MTGVSPSPPVVLRGLPVGLLETCEFPISRFRGLSQATLEDKGIINPWSLGVERNIGFLCTMYVPPGLKGLRV